MNEILCGDVVEQLKPPVFVCSGCGKPILEGDIYADVLQEQFCFCCISKTLKTAVKAHEKTS